MGEDGYKTDAGMRGHYELMRAQVADLLRLLDAVGSGQIRPHHLTAARMAARRTRKMLGLADEPNLQRGSAAAEQIHALRGLYELHAGDVMTISNNGGGKIRVVHDRLRDAEIRATDVFDIIAPGAMRVALVRRTDVVDPECGAKGGK